MRHVYEIRNTISGTDLGGYEAESGEAALDLWAQDAGYSDYAHACKVAPVKPGEIVTVLQPVPEPERAFDLIDVLSTLRTIRQIDAGAHLCDAPDCRAVATEERVVSEVVHRLCAGCAAEVPAG